MSARIDIFDTTLRDGEQSPGINLNVREKLEIAEQLEILGVNIIEAGFPIASKGDFDAVREVAKLLKKTKVAGLARATQKDIDTAWEALKHAKYPRIHTFIATSDIHMKYKLKMNPEDVLRAAGEMVVYARNLCGEIEFSPEDAFRSDREFLYRVLEKVIASGASIVNIPDTVGYATPEEFGLFIKGIAENVPNIQQAVISVHCHNDLGLAVANSLEAVKNGACQVECTINGLGERAGNAALEEIVMALSTRKNLFQKETTVNTEQIHRTSSLVSHLTGVQIQPNKAIVGANAFAHESGIHQHGVLSHQQTYEIMTPESIGLKQNKLVLGKHSGRHAFEERLKELGFEKINKEKIADLFTRFKDLADKKKHVMDTDIEALVNEELSQVSDNIQLDYFHVSSGNTLLATATVRISMDEKEIEEAACGDGPVDAIFKAIDRAVNMEVILKDYYIKAVTSGKDALGEVIIKVEKNDNRVVGHGVSTDIVEASAKAYINALNKLMN